MQRWMMMLACGIALLIAAACEPSCATHVAPRVALLVDLSPSTRGAWWRSPDRLREFADRFDQIILFPFADGGSEGSIDAYTGQTVEVDQTSVIPPVDADIAIVLTDGWLSLSDATMPVLFVGDSALTPSLDNHLTRLEIDGDSVVVVGSGAMSLDGQPIDAAAARMAHHARASAAAAASGGDRWPENDRLELPAAPAGAGLRFALGIDVPEGLTSFDVSALPSASVVAVGDGAQISPQLADALASYVRTNAGTLIFAGVEPPPALERLLPITFTPPKPRGRWIVLIDASGSMAQGDNGGRTDAAARAARRAIEELPAESILDIATFADTLTWLSRGVRREELQSVALAIQAGGKTNLAGALRDAVGGSEQPGAVDLLVITDADTPDAMSVLPALASRGARVHVLHVGARVDASLQALVASTGGRLIRATDPLDWQDRAADLVRTASRPEVQGTTQSLRLTSEFDGRMLAITPWREAWVKEGANAASEAGDGANAALWWVGGGRVLAISGRVASPDIAALAEELAAEPVTDIAVSWQDGASLQVAVDVQSASSVRLRRDDRVVDAMRIGPKRWFAELAGQRPAGVAVVEVDGRPVASRPTASRYAAEFEAIGNNPAMHLVEPGQLEIPYVERRRSLTTLFALAGMLAMLAGALDMAGIRLGRGAALNTVVD